MRKLFGTGAVVLGVVGILLVRCGSRSWLAGLR